MAKLYFRYGAMGCGKTMQLLQVAFNYEERGHQVCVMKPKTDTKNGQKLLTRIGPERETDLCFDKNTDLFKEVAENYAGVACEMDTIMDIAARHNLKVIEDAAQGVMSSYKGRALGTIGDFGCFSFHETKNYSMGEGGALLIKHEKDIEEAEIIREKGTNSSKFYRGQIDKYTWVNYGSSYLPSDMNAAYLYAQLEMAEEINAARLSCWNRYYENLTPLAEAGYIELPVIPEGCVHNAHMFYIKAKDIEERTELIDFLKDKGVHSVFHYIPLHTAPAGLKFARFHGEDRYTTKESERLTRLPMFYGLTLEQVDYICEQVKSFYGV